MNIIDAVQGTQEWHAHRAHHFNASDAPAMMGLSPYKTRSELLREMATGITPEIDPATQRRFDDGHRFEALARPLAENILGEELFPVVGHEGKLSASFDGLTMDGSVCFEHKTINAAYREAIATGGKLPDALLVQIEQQLWVSQAERCLFMASKWTPDGELVEEVHCMVESDPALLNEVIKGWDQFQHDLENYRHEEVIAAPVAATIEALPALFVQVEGKVLATNLDAFKLAAQTFIDGIKTELVNDQDFADADKMVKFLKDGEERLALAKQQALAQTASIDELFRTVDAISEQMRSKRLALDKLVKAEKINRKAAIISDARQALDAHVAKLNERIGGLWMPTFNDGGFAEAIAGMKSLDSMRDKVSTALANAKIEANAIADTIEANRKSLTTHGAAGRDWIVLFPDFPQVCTKSIEDFHNLVTARVAQDVQRQEAEREKIRQEEAAKLTANNQTQFEDQRGNAQTYTCEQPDTSHLRQNGDGQQSVHADAREMPATEVASTPPIQVHLADAAMITEFLALQSCSPAAKKEMRAVLERWETYRCKMMSARGLAAAA